MKRKQEIRTKNNNINPNSGKKSYWKRKEKHNRKRKEQLN